MIWFATASLTPALLLAMGAQFGGIWPAAGVFAITVLVFFLDRLASRTLPESADHDGLGLSLVLGVVHLALLPLVVWGVAAGDMGLLNKVLMITGAGLWFGQVSNSNAHELIHRSARGPRRFGRLLYASILYGHHATAHVRVHHVHAATAADPNSARLGEGFWSFAFRCAKGEFVHGLRAENAARARRTPPPSWISHPYVQDGAISVVTLGLAYALAGASGVLVLVLIAVYAALQLMLSDYVQHYGLRRKTLATGKPEPMGPAHSWNAPRWYSSAMMLNAPRHSDHHVNPTRTYPKLQLDKATMPRLPQSLPVMAVIALFPPIWRRVMDHRVLRWQNDRDDTPARRSAHARASVGLA